MRQSTLLRPRSTDKVQRGALLVPAVALVAALALTACGRRGPEGGNGPGEGAPAAGAHQNDAAGGQGGGRSAAAMTVTVEAVRNEPITRSVLATGSIHPWQEVVIGPEVGGYRVSAVLVDVGDSVKKGQVLVRLSSDLLEAEVASRRAAVRSAEADALNANAALKRGETIKASGALSDADLDRLRAEQVAAQARVESAASDLHTAELRLKYTNVTSPDDGVVSSRTVSVGQIAQAGTEMLRLLRQKRVEWRAEVPEAQVALIKPGQAANLTGADGTRIEGKVRAVAPTVSVTSRTALVYVDIHSGNARPGMFARGAIDVGTGDALLVPAPSVVMQDGYSYVFVLKDGDKVERRRVQAANVRGTDMELTSGVQPGERIAVKGAGFLKDGDTVAIAKDAEAPTALASSQPSGDSP
jgi:RND family efflux transporter MFP subunit